MVCKVNGFRSKVFLSVFYAWLTLWVSPCLLAQTSQGGDVQETVKNLELNSTDLLVPEPAPSPSPPSDLFYNPSIEMKNLKTYLDQNIPNRSGGLELSYENAVKLAILNNLKTLIAQEKTREAKGDFLRGLSGLLPQLQANVSQSRRTSNVVAEGFDPSSFPTLPTGVFGPYNSFDARIKLLQNIFDLSAIGSYQAGVSNQRLAKFQVELAEQMVSSLAGLAYVQLLQSQEDVKAAEGDLQLSKTLLEDTQVAFKAGVVTGVDLSRAEANYNQNLTRLIRAKTQVATSDLNLKKIILVPMGSSLKLTSQLKEGERPPPQLKRALQTAVETRPDIKIAKEEIRFRGYQHRAAVGKQVPSLGFGATYGGSGVTPTEGTAGTYQLAGQLSIPIFDGGNTIGEIKVAKSKQKQAELSFNNLRQEVDEEVRVALEKMKFSLQEIASTKETVRVTHQELELARERFFAGVGDNLEVVHAQSSLATARDAYIRALADYNNARIRLATAMGTIDQFEL